jgi:cyclophilin family peptidyl-prolyl cis-trans isomerase
VILISRGGGDDDGGDTTSASSGSKGGCEKVEAPEPKSVSFKAPKQVLKKGEAATAVVKTSCGSFEIALDFARAPKTASSFAFLAEEGLYDDTLIHRIEPGFVVQGGDPHGDGTGGPGYFVDEQPPQNLTYTRGTVAMAKTAAEPPGRSGSQFFIVTAPADAGLPPDYALLGKVSEGFETVERIQSLVGPDGEQAAPAVIETITLEQG